MQTKPCSVQYSTRAGIVLRNITSECDTTFVILKLWFQLPTFRIAKINFKNSKTLVDIETDRPQQYGRSWRKQLHSALLDWINEAENWLKGVRSTTRRC